MAQYKTTGTDGSNWKPPYPKFSYDEKTAIKGPNGEIGGPWAVNPLKLPDNYIYISHLDEDYKFWRLPGYPDQVSDTMQSQFSQNIALGRSAPVFTYSNSGPRTVQVALALHRDLMDDLNMSWSNAKLGYGEDYVDNLLHALQAIALPRYNLTNKAIEPPLVGLRICNEFFIKGVVTGGIGLTYKKPILDNNKYACVDLSLSIAEVDPYDATEVFKQGHFRGLVNTLRTGFNALSDK